MAAKHRKPEESGSKPIAQDLLLVGKFGGPQGVKGEIRIRSFTADPMAIASYGPLTDSTGTQVYRVLQARPAKNDMVIVRVDGVSDRTEAEMLTNRDLYIPRNLLPEPEEDEFYHADLIGLAARLQNGLHFGKVMKIENYGAGDILEVLTENNETTLIPFIKIHVPLINQAEGFLIVEPPELVEPDDEENSNEMKKPN